MQRKGAVWAKQIATTESCRNQNLQAIVTDALMDERSPALGGVRKRSCMRLLEIGVIEYKYTNTTNSPVLYELKTGANTGTLLSWDSI